MGVASLLPTSKRKASTAPNTPKRPPCGTQQPSASGNSHPPTGARPIAGDAPPETHRSSPPAASSPGTGLTAPARRRRRGAALRELLTQAAAGGSGQQRPIFHVGHFLTPPLGSTYITTPISLGHHSLSYLLLLSASLPLFVLSPLFSSLLFCIHTHTPLSHRKHVQKRCC